MSDPNERKPYNSTSQLAGAVAAANSGNRRAQILLHLEQHGPSALFEVAAAIGCFDHQISGRFTDMERDGLIEKTGVRKTKPETGCQAEVWRLRQPLPPLRPEVFGYPLTLAVQGEGLFKRVELDPHLPGIPYVRDTSEGATAQKVWIAIIECPGCGKPLRYLPEQGPGGTTIKNLKCTTPACGPAPWQVTTVNTPGSTPVLALIRKTL